MQFEYQTSGAATTDVEVSAHVGSAMMTSLESSMVGIVEDEVSEQMIMEAEITLDINEGCHEMPTPSTEEGLASSLMMNSTEGLPIGTELPQTVVLELSDLSGLPMVLEGELPVETELPRHGATDLDDDGDDLGDDVLQQRRYDSEMSRLRRKVFTRSVRKGKWTTEEAHYAEQLIVFFKERLLQVSKGTMLRMFLSEKLHCEPMRITKKFSGKNSIGKQVYSGFQKGEDALRLRQEARNILKPLERNFLTYAAMTPNLIKSPIDSARILGRKKRTTVRKAAPLTTTVYDISGKENLAMDASLVSKNIAEMSASSRKRSNSIIDDQRAGDLLMGFVSKVYPQPVAPAQETSPTTTISPTSTV